MSMILEALRKSEAERRRGQMPDLRAELPPVPQRRARALPTAWWLPPAAAVLALAAWWGARERTPPAGGGTAPSSIETGASATPSAAPSAAADLPVRTPMPPPASQPAAVPTTASGAAVEPQPPRAPASPDPVAIAQPARPVEPAVRPPSRVPAPAGIGRVQNVGELDADARKGLPPLKLSMHMWNARPAQRFVIIDGQRLTEGDRVGAAVVERIEADGVLLDWNGRRLKLGLR